MKEKDTQKEDVVVEEKKKKSFKDFFTYKRKLIILIVLLAIFIYPFVVLLFTLITEPHFFEVDEMEREPSRPPVVEKEIEEEKPKEETKQPVTQVEESPKTGKSNGLSVDLIDYYYNRNSISDFDLNFLKFENSSKNKVYSPISIKYTLMMLLRGAKGNTSKQIQDVMGGYSPRSYTNNDHMSFANAMFVKNTMSGLVKENYATILKNSYKADIMYDDFKSASTINNWIDEKTFHMIQNMLSDEDVADTNYFLANALAIDMDFVNWIWPLHYTTASYSHMKYHKVFDGLAPIYDSRASMATDYKYSSILFNNQTEVKTAKLFASLNNYDIVETLGEENIRNTVEKAYEEWRVGAAVTECGFDPNSLSPTYDEMDTYIRSLDSNYGTSYSSTDFYIYDDEEIKVFAKDLKEYDGLTLQYVGIMPKTKALNTYIEGTSAKKIKKIVNSLKPLKANYFKEGYVTEVTGEIPFFKIDYSLNLLDDLKKMGIVDVFDSSKADLSNILESPSYVVNTAHKATIEFSNQGIKAAAASTVGGAGAAAGCGFDYEFDVPIYKMDITFDKPYMYLVIDKDTKEVWFAGTVYNPVSK